MIYSHWFLEPQGVSIADLNWQYLGCSDPESPKNVDHDPGGIQHDQINMLIWGEIWKI